MNVCMRHYETLYVLRLNKECTDAYIEEYKLSKYRELKDIFDIYLKPLVNLDEMEKRRLVNRNLGASRLINFHPDKKFIEFELNNVRQSLKNYHSTVTKVRESLIRHGYEDCRQVSSKKNLDAFCSFYDTFYLYDRPFIKLMFRLGNILRIDPIATEYDVPCWTIEFLHNGGYSIRQHIELKKDEKTIDQWLELIIKDSNDCLKVKKEIAEQIQNAYDVKIQFDDILYNPVNQCYLLKEKEEQNLLKDLMPEHDVESDEIAKYTSFETLISILQSGKIRMNSIVSMNDKTETDFLEGTIRNFKEEYERDIDKYLFADKQFITSFTTRIDDLDMWRLYGDDARGVCLVFERKNKSNDKLYKIKYVSPDDEILKKTAQGGLSVAGRCRCLTKDSNTSIEKEGYIPYSLQA